MIQFQIVSDFLLCVCVCQHKKYSRELNTYNPDSSEYQTYTCLDFKWEEHNITYMVCFITFCAIFVQISSNHLKTRLLFWEFISSHHTRLKRIIQRRNFWIYKYLIFVKLFDIAWRWIVSQNSFDGCFHCVLGMYLIIIDYIISLSTLY